MRGWRTSGEALRMISQEMDITYDNDAPAQS